MFFLDRANQVEEMMYHHSTRNVESLIKRTIKKAMNAVHVAKD